MPLTANLTFENPNKLQISRYFRTWFLNPRSPTIGAFTAYVCIIVHCGRQSSLKLVKRLKKKQNETFGATAELMKPLRSRGLLVHLLNVTIERNNLSLPSLYSSTHFGSLKMPNIDSINKLKKPSLSIFAADYNHADRVPLSAVLAELLLSRASPRNLFTAAHLQLSKGTLRGLYENYETFLRIHSVSNVPQKWFRFSKSP